MSLSVKLHRQGDRIGYERELRAMPELRQGVHVGNRPAYAQAHFRARRLMGLWEFFFGDEKENQKRRDNEARKKVQKMRNTRDEQTVSDWFASPTKRELDLIAEKYGNDDPRKGMSGGWF